MDSALERALADEVLAEVARQRVTASEMQRRTGIKARTWANYFVNQSSRIPVSAVYAVADALGLPGYVLMQRAEVRVVGGDHHEAAAERALGQLPPDLADLARRVDREQRDAREDDSPVTVRPDRVSRSATTGP